MGAPEKRTGSGCRHEPPLRFVSLKDCEFPVVPLCSGNADALLSMGRVPEARSVRLTLHYRPVLMTPDSDDPRATFDYFSGEYAQALQALQTIQAQAPTLLLMGHHDELRQFIDQFIEMARRTRSAAIEKNESNFAEWFDELVQKAEKVRADGR
jgi:hypothetical protein